jgi:3-oxoacyl-[acyl-carrier-protein] synthase-1
MSHQPVAITGLGMATSLGTDAPNVCAAARAGITRPSKLTCMNFGGARHFGRETRDGVLPITGHMGPVAPGFTAKAKLTLLGSGALADLLSRAGLEPRDLAKCPILVNVSDRFLEQAYEARIETGAIPERFSYPPQQWKTTAADVLGLVLKRVGAEIPPSNRELYFGGHAGFAVAVHQACEHIRCGQAERVIVGAIDSCVEPRFLDAAASIHTLKTGDNPVGFSPGEASVFALLEGTRSVNTPRKIAAWVAGAGFDEDLSHQFTEKPAVGNALARAIQKAVSQSTSRSTSAFVVGDLNGSERRATDWGYAILRLRRNLNVGDLPLWLPSMSFGECGAAAGGLATCLAVRAFQRGYAPGAQALIALASDSGARASLILEQAAA